MLTMLKRLCFHVMNVNLHPKLFISFKKFDPSRAPRFSLQKEKKPQDSQRISFLFSLTPLTVLFAHIAFIYISLAQEKKLSIQIANHERINSSISAVARSQITMKFSVFFSPRRDVMQSWLIHCQDKSEV